MVVEQMLLFLIFDQPNSLLWRQLLGPLLFFMFEG